MKRTLLIVSWLFVSITTCLKAQINLALTADSILTSHVSTWENLNAINDGYNPENSSDKTGGAYGNWESGANSDWDWVEYDWNELKDIWQSDIYWWTDGGGIQFPYNTYQEYWDVIKNDWKSLPNAIGNGYEPDKYNLTSFDTVLTNKIRVYAISTIATGILEWKVWGRTGEQIPLGSQCNIDSELKLNDTSTIIVTAKELSGNFVQTYKFKLHIVTKNDVPGTNEEYEVNGIKYSDVDTIIELSATNSVGESQINVVMPLTIDPTDGIELKVLFNNGLTQIGETYSLFQPGLAPPQLIHDITDNNVDHNLEISFADDASWRNAISYILINNSALVLSSDYDITPGMISLKPSGGNACLISADTVTIKIIAPGYAIAEAQQIIIHGAVDVSNCSVRTLTDLYLNAITKAELIARDQYNNPVPGYIFKYDLAITNNNTTTAESYTVGTGTVNTSVTDQVTNETDANGITTLKIGIPGVVDLNDGINIQFKLQDNSQLLSSVYYSNNGTEKEIVIQPEVKNNPDFSWENSAQSKNFIVFWGKKIKGDPTDAINGSLRFDPNNILEIMESLLSYMTDTIGFIDNANEGNMAKYKHQIVMNETWTNGSFTGYAFGGSINNKIGGMWIHPSATGGPAVLAHEFTHMCQAMVLLQYPGYGLNADYAGFFWESHANYYMAQYSKTYTGVQIDRYINTAMLHFSTTRHYYQNLYFIDHIRDKYGLNTTHLIWRNASPRISHPLTSLRDSVLHYAQADLNDEFIEMAMKNVTWDYHNGSLMRKAIKAIDPIYIGREYTILDEVNGQPGTYVVPQYLAPGDYGYNIIPLYPNEGSSEISVDFTGYDNEPAGGAGWRYGFVAVNSEGTSRYSDYYSSQNETVTFSLNPSDSAIFLVVTGAPSVHHNYGWTTGFPKEYRYPYSIKIIGALPAGFKDGYNSQKTKFPGAPHSNGGGWVASTATVSSTAFVDLNAQVLGNAKVTGNSRIEDYAVVTGNATVGGSSVVKDNAIVGGTSKLSLNARVEKTSRVYNSTIKDNVLITGSALVYNSTISGKAKIKDLAYLSGVTLSGTVIIGGDAEEYTGCSAGTYLQMQTVRTTGCDGKVYHKLNVDINPDWEIYKYPLGPNPTTPLNLSADNITSVSVDLNWEPSQSNEEIAGYYIIQNGTVVSTVDTTAATVSDLDPGTSYKFTVQALDNSGNVSELSNEIEIETIATTITSFTEGDISIFPNPTEQDITITMKSPVKSSISITNIQGSTVYSGEIESELSLNMSQLGGSGIYILKIKNGDKVYDYKFIVQ